jgi:hypothetical protein
MKQPLSLGDLDRVTATGGQAFCAMTRFLEQYFERTEGHGAIRTLIGDMEIERGGTSTDPAALADWQACLMSVLAENGCAPDG